MACPAKHWSRIPLTWAALSPLAMPDLPEGIGRRLVEEHLLSEREFLTPVAPPSVAVSEPSYEPGGSRGPIRRYWRGPTWINAAWLLWLGLRRLGYHQEAERMANGLIGTVEREGLPNNVRETHVSLFDGSNCGIELADRPAFSVQYHPEASPGPQDSFYLFQRFVGML